MVVQLYHRKEEQGTEDLAFRGMAIAKSCVGEKEKRGKTAGTRSPANFPPTMPTGNARES